MTTPTKPIKTPRAVESSGMVRLLKASKTAAGLKTREVAHLVGVPEETVWSWLKGQRIPDKAEHMRPLIRTFGWTPEQVARARGWID